VLLANNIDQIKKKEYKMESNTIPVLLSMFRQYEPYKNLNDYYIKKKIGQDMGIKTVKKADLIKTLKHLSTTSQPENMIALPVDDVIAMTIVMNTNPYELMDLYIVNTTFKTILDNPHTLELLHNKYDLYYHPSATFQSFLIGYVYETLPRFGKIKYLEVELIHAVNKIGDTYGNYQIKVTDHYNKGSDFDKAIQFLIKQGYMQPITPTRAALIHADYGGWLRRLFDRVHKDILSKKGQYTVIDKAYNK